jgi:2,3-dihydroxybenzoate decarboxylase
LPLQDPAGAAVELERCVRQLGLSGALVNDCIHRPGGHCLDAPEYDEVWAALEALGVALDGRRELYGPTGSWGAAVSGHALRILFAGVFRPPSLRPP